MKQQTRNKHTTTDLLGFVVTLSKARRLVADAIEECNDVWLQTQDDEVGEAMVYLAKARELIEA